MKDEDLYRPVWSFSDPELERRLRGACSPTADEELYVLPGASAYHVLLWSFSGVRFRRRCTVRLGADGSASTTGPFRLGLLARIGRFFARFFS